MKYVIRKNDSGNMSRYFWSAKTQTWYKDVENATIFTKEEYEEYHKNFPPSFGRGEWYWEAWYESDLTNHQGLI